ncbi:hypothetical protein [Pontiella sp.]|uniref:hypothetical protein n=1 Tax=Pontiella sp. TaxID=2837462 RepID=UPI003561D700
MKWKAVFYSFIAVFMAAGCASRSNTPVPVAEHVDAIGVYDSRAVALAFLRTPCFMQVVHDMECRHCDQELAEMKRMLLPQVHSTAPVDNILGYIGPRIPAVLETADVDLLVSKWDEASCRRYASASQVDVTMLLVAQFNPSRTLVADVLETISFEPLEMDYVEALQ